MKSVRQGYKMTELGEIPEEWKIVNLEEVINEFIVPMRDKPKVFDGDIPWCRIEDIEGNYLNGNKESRFVSEKTIKEMNLKVFPQGTLIASCSATLGVYAINTTPLITNQTFIGLVPSEKINVNYLLYYMNTTTDRLKNIASGTTIPYISRQKFEKFKIVLPNIEEQEKIASILSTVDEQIDNIDALIEKNKELKKGLMQTLLTKGVGHTKFKKTEVGEIPEEWEVKELKEIVDFINGKGHEKFIDEDGKYIVVNSKFVSTEGAIKKYSNENLCPLYKEQIAIVMSDVPNGKAIAKCYYIDKDNLYTLNQRIGGLKSDKVSSRYLFYYLDRNKYFLKFDDGVKQTNLRRDEVLGCPVLLPGKYEQEKIASILMQADEKIKEYENKKRKLEELKTGLMQQLLTGKIRVI